jgi:hypothetical protein
VSWEARTFAVLLVLFAGATSALPAAALEWRSAHAVTAQANSDSNLYLSAATPKSAQYANVSVQADLTARRPGLSLDLASAVRAVRYAEDAQDDRNDGSADFGLSWARPRQSVSFGARYEQESTLTSEFESSGLRGDVARVQRGVDGAYSRALGAGRSLDIAASSVDTLYGDSEVSPVPLYRDYGEKTLQLSHRVARTERITFSAVASKSFVDAPVAAADSTTTALSASWSVGISPHLTGTFGVGAFAVDYAGAASEDPSASFSFALARQWLRWSASVSAGRDARPQSGGLVVVEDAVALGARRTVRERLNVGMELRGAHTSSPLDGLFDFDRTYSTTGVTVNWQAARRLTLVASVYERAEDTSFTRRASGLVGSVSLTYRGR